MALLITKDNRPIFLKAETARLLWLVKTGERKGTAEIRAKVKSIAKWYLNKETAPVSYLKEYPETVERKVRGKVVATQARLPYKD